MIGYKTAIVHHDALIRGFQDPYLTLVIGKSDSFHVQSIERIHTFNLLALISLLVSTSLEDSQQHRSMRGLKFRFQHAQSFTERKLENLKRY